MKKQICYLLLILLLAGMLPFQTAAAETPEPSSAFYVNDFADVISEEVENEIIEYGRRLDEQTGTQVVLVTIDFTNGESMENYSMDLFNKWKIGSEEKNNGLLILLSVGDDDYWAMQGTGLEDTLSSGKISSILNEYLEPDFAAKDYSGGAEKVYGAFVQELGGQWKTASDNSETISHTAGQYVIDEVGIINEDTINYINKKSLQSKNKYNAAVYVVTKDYCKEGISFQEDTINTFEEINAGTRDAVLVLYRGDDNYWLLPGKESERFIKDGVLRGILDQVLEPEFAAQNYSQGATATADHLYLLFQNNFQRVKSTVPVKEAVSTDKYGINNKKANQQNPSFNPAPLLIIIIIILLVRGNRRKLYRQVYGIPFNPYKKRYIRKYGPQGYWGPNGYPPMHRNGFGGGMPPMGGNSVSSGSFWSSSSGTGDSTPKSSFWGSSGGAGRSSSKSSSWGSSGGAGRSSTKSSFWGSSSGSDSSSKSSFWGSSSGSASSTKSSSWGSSGGAGRSSSQSSSWGSSGSGGSSSGGGAGRSSGMSSGSGGGRSASGGGGSTRGGGAGRNK